MSLILVKNLTDLNDQNQTDLNGSWEKFRRCVFDVFCRAEQDSDSEIRLPKYWIGC